jgi:hypothetical protein
MFSIKRWLSPPAKAIFFVRIPATAYAKIAFTAII